MSQHKNDQKILTFFEMQNENADYIKIMKKELKIKDTSNLTVVLNHVMKRSKKLRIGW